jgi:raffinose/stachyose/melibiose transport system permease protein
MRFPSMSKLVSGVLILALLIPAGSLLVPLYILLRQLQVYNTPLALIFPYVTFGLPLTVFVVSAFLRSLPSELEEAGVMDGLSATGLLWRVVLPLTMPTLTTVFILNFLSNWNEFIMANLFLAKEQLRTLPVGMVAFYDQLNMNYGGLCAAIMFSVVPVVIIYSVLQKQIIEGVTAGSVKG